MRVLIVNVYGFITGGADRHCFELADLLERRGHEVAFLATEDHRNVVLRGGFVPRSVGNEDRSTIEWGEQLGAAARAFWNRSAAGAMRHLIGEFNPDVVHVHKVYPQLSVSPVWVAHRAGLPIVQTVHDYEFLSGSAFDDSGAWIDRNESARRYRALNTAMVPVRRYLHAPRVTRWIAVSQFIADQYGKRGLSARVLPNFTTMITGRSPGFEERSGVLYLGRLTREKGVLDLIDAARQAPSLPFTFAGSGDLQEAVRSAAERKHNIEYVGLVPSSETASLLRGARVIAMPSHWSEPGPLSCLEAMAAGTPIVCFDQGGLAEYVRNARAGVVADSGVPALLQAVRMLHDDEDQWQALSAGGRDAAETTHSPGQYVLQVEGVYRAAIEDHARDRG